MRYFENPFDYYLAFAGTHHTAIQCWYLMIQQHKGGWGLGDGGWRQKRKSWG